MKRIIAICFCVGALSFLGLAWHARRSTIGSALNESYDHKLARYRHEAPTALLLACTNYIPGIHAIISTSIQSYDKNFMKWTASASLDYINAFGGIQRTNLDFNFDPGLSGKAAWFRK